MRTVRRGMAKETLDASGKAWPLNKHGLPATAPRDEAGPGQDD